MHRRSCSTPVRSYWSCGLSLMWQDAPTAHCHLGTRHYGLSVQRLVGCYSGSWVRCGCGVPGRSTPENEFAAMVERPDIGQACKCYAVDLFSWCARVRAEPEFVERFYNGRRPVPTNSPGEKRAGTFTIPAIDGATYPLCSRDVDLVDGDASRRRCVNPLIENKTRM